MSSIRILMSLINSTKQMSMHGSGTGKQHIRSIRNSSYASRLRAISYFLILTSLALPEIVLFLETSFAIVALGIGALLGPIFIALYLLPFSWAKQLFWSWFHAMIKYAFYRVFASALVFIWATAEMAFITQMFGGKLSFGSWSASILGLLVFNVACGILCLRLPRLVSDFTGGSASAGGGMAMAAVTVGSRFL